MSLAQDLQMDELLREVILDHYRRPRRRGALEGATHAAEGMNPVCGDEVTVHLALDQGMVCEIAFAGNGCSISQASASMMSETVVGRDAAGVAGVTEAVRRLLQTGALDPAHDLGDVESLQGVAQFPVRVKCALLCWNVLERALQQPISDTKESLP